MEAREVIAKVAEGLGIERRDAYRRVRLVDLSFDQVVEDLSREGWPERFERAWRAGQERAVIEGLTRLLRRGPMKLAAMSREQLRVLIHEPKLAQFADQYSPDQHGGRMILSPTGLGKTTACVSMFHRLAAEMALEHGPRKWSGGWNYDTCKEEPERFMWVRSFDLPNARLEHKLGDGEADLIERACEVQYLVLDDLGWESRRAGADDVVMEVLAARYDRGLVTVATTGMRLDQLIERYGEAVVRRVVESGGLPGRALNLWPEATHV